MKTKSQANDFATRLSRITARLYETNFNLERELIDEFGIQKKDKIMTLLRTNNITIEKVDAIRDFFVKIQNNITRLPVLEVTLAFEPKDKTLLVLSEWFLLNIKHQMLLSISIDTNLIGGAKLGFNGKYMDASVKPAFDNVIKEMLSPQ